MRWMVWLTLACLALTACGKKEPEPAEPMPEEPPASMSAEPELAPVSAPEPQPAEPLAEPEDTHANPLPLPDWEPDAHPEADAKTEPEIPPLNPAPKPLAGAKTTDPGFDPPAAHKSQPEPAAPQPAKKAGPTVVVATIETVSAVPDPASVPYKDCLTLIKYKVNSVSSGSYDADELLAAHWGMKDGKRTAAASYKVGQKKTLTIEPMTKHSDLSRVMQADDTGEYSLPAYFVVKAK